MKTIEQILVERDGLTPEEAEARVEKAREQFSKLTSFEDMWLFCEEEFGLEPDYAMQLI